MPVDRDRFRATLGRFATGVTVITTRDAEGRDHGMTVSAFSSVSLDPPLVLACIGHAATMAPVMARVDHFTVHVLAAGQEALSRQFAGARDDRFDGLAVQRAPSGNAVLPGVLAWLDCRVVARHPAGDHVIVVGSVEEASTSDADPLVYFRGAYARLAG